MTRDRPASNPPSESKRLWAILKPPRFEKVYRIYLQPGTGPQPKPLVVTATYEVWQFENPNDALNWLETLLQPPPEPT
jgi:hypothetical protein